MDEQGARALNRGGQDVQHAHDGGSNKSSFGLAVRRRLRCRRRRPKTTAQVPAVLPRIVVTPASGQDDCYTLAVNHDHPSAQTIPAAGLGHAIAEAADRLGSAVRVEIHEPCGRIRADIISAPGHDDNSHPDPAPADREASSYPGFAPGEDIHAGVVTHTITADDTGTARVDLTVLPQAPDRKILLIGVSSRTVLVVKPA